MHTDASKVDQACRTVLLRFILSMARPHADLRMSLARALHEFSPVQPEGTPFRDQVAILDRAEIRAREALDWRTLGRVRINRGSLRQTGDALVIGERTGTCE